MALGFLARRWWRRWPCADGPAVDGGRGSNPGRARGDRPTKGLKEGFIGFIRPLEGLSWGGGTQVVQVAPQLRGTQLMAGMGLTQAAAAVTAPRRV